MRIVLTGGAGYIGSHTLVKLLANGHDILVLDNYANSAPEALKRVRNMTNRDFQSEEIDIRDQDLMVRAFNAFRPEAVIHFAGLKAVGEGEAKPLEYYDVNIGGTLSLIRAMNASGCDKIIFSSSATVYGDPDYLPIDENHPCRPANVYGRTKYMAEQVIEDWARANSEKSAVLLRYFNPVGAHESGLIGEDPKGIPNNLMPFIAQVAAGQREELTIFGDDYDTRDGTGLRDYIHVTDLAQAHVAALDYAANQSGKEVFNIGTGYGTTVKEALAAYTRACGRDIPAQVIARRPGDVAACYADPRKALRVLGWQATHNINEMCVSSWKWQCDNPHGYGV